MVDALFVNFIFEFVSVIIHNPIQGYYYNRNRQRNLPINYEKDDN